MKVTICINMHMYTSVSMCGPSMVSIGSLVIEKLILSWKLDINLRKSVDRENEVKFRRHMPGWHVHTMINMWTKYGETRLYVYWEAGLVTKSSHFLTQSLSWEMQHTYVFPSVTIITGEGKKRIVAIVTLRSDVYMESVLVLIKEEITLLTSLMSFCINGTIPAM